MLPVRRPPVGARRQEQPTTRRGARPRGHPRPSPRSRGPRAREGAKAAAPRTTSPAPVSPPRRFRTAYNRRPPPPPPRPARRLTAAAAALLLIHEGRCARATRVPAAVDVVAVGGGGANDAGAVMVRAGREPGGRSANVGSDDHHRSLFLLRQNAKKTIEVTSSSSSGPGPASARQRARDSGPECSRASRRVRCRAHGSAAQARGARSEPNGGLCVNEFPSLSAGELPQRCLDDGPGCGSDSGVMMMVTTVMMRRALTRG